MNLLKHRMVSNVELLAPLYICSIGSHIFNIINKESLVYTEGSLRADTRVHVIMVTVPGFGKSYMLKQFLDDEKGIVAKTMLAPRFCASMTTASFIGSMKTTPNGETMTHRGIADKYSKSILGIHEFAELTNSMKQTYNVGLIDAFLTALDDGKITKDVVSGEISYETSVSMFAAVQPARYDLSSGLGRRLAFLVYIPSQGDIEELRFVRRNAKNVTDDNGLLANIREGVDKLFGVCKSIKHVEFDKGFYTWMDRNNIIPYEEIIYERIGVGYTIMKGGIYNGVLNVKMDSELDRLFTKQRIDRNSIKNGVDSEQVLEVIKRQTKVSKNDLVNHLMEFSLTRDSITSKLNKLRMLKLITVNGDIIEVNK